MFLHGNCLRVALFWAVAAFAAATIVVAVQRNQLEADLRDMREKIDMYEALNGSQLAVDSNRQKRQTLEEVSVRVCVCVNA